MLHLRVRIARPERGLRPLLRARGQAGGPVERGGRSRIVGRVVERRAEAHGDLIAQLALRLLRLRALVALHGGRILLPGEVLLARQEERLCGIAAFRVVGSQALELRGGAIMLFQLRVVPGEIIPRPLGERPLLSGELQSGDRLPVGLVLRQRIA